MAPGHNSDITGCLRAAFCRLCRYRTLRRGRCASWTSAHMPLASCWRRRSTRLPCSSNPPRWQSSSSRTSTSKKRVPAAASTAARPQSCPPFPYNSSSSARWLVFPSIPPLSLRRCTSALSPFHVGAPTPPSLARIPLPPRTHLRRATMTYQRSGHTSLSGHILTQP